jgi:hypothetical protein
MSLEDKNGLQIIEDQKRLHYKEFNQYFVEPSQMPNVESNKLAQEVCDKWSENNKY